MNHTCNLLPGIQAEGVGPATFLRRRLAKVLALGFLAAILGLSLSWLSDNPFALTFQTGAVLITAGLIVVAVAALMMLFRSRRVLARIVAAFCILVGLLSLFLVGIIAAKNRILWRSRLTKESWQQDVRYLSDLTVRVHPNAFAHVSQDTYDQEIANLQAQLSTLTDQQIEMRLVRADARVRILDVEDDGRLRLDQLDALLSERTKLVVFPHVSNVLGLINPAKEICERAHRVGALVLVDAAQSVPHFSVDVQELGCDFLAFSGHKMLSPMGTGVLWARREILENMPPYQAGSNMAHDVDLESRATHFAEGAWKFEAGTPNVPGPVGLAAAIEFLESLGRKDLWTREQELTRHALSSFKEVKGLRILGPTEPDKRISVFSFVLEKSDALDIVKALDAMGFALRGGDLASLPLLKRMGLTEAVRASCYAYTTAEEVDLLVAALQRERRGHS